MNNTSGKSINILEAKLFIVRMDLNLKVSVDNFRLSQKGLFTS